MMTKRTVEIKAGLTKKEGIAKVIKKAMREFGGDYRGAGYNTKTGKGWVI